MYRRHTGGRTSILRLKNNRTAGGRRATENGEYTFGITIFYESIPYWTGDAHQARSSNPRTGGAEVVRWWNFQNSAESWFPSPAQNPTSSFVKPAGPAPMAQIPPKHDERIPALDWMSATSVQIPIRRQAAASWLVKIACHLW